MIVLLKRFDGISILDINKKLFGKYVGFIINLLLTIYLLVSVVINLRLYVIIVASWFFRTMPLWMLTIVLISPCVYITYKGLKGICRFDIIVFYVIFISTFVIVYSIGHFRPTLLMPVGGNGLLTIIKGIPNTSYAFLGFETLLFIFPFIKDKKNITKNIVAGSIISTLLFVGISIICFGVFGEKMVEIRTMPFLGLTRMAKFPIFERVDMYFLASWIPGMTICIHAYLFLTLYSLNKVVKIKPGIPALLVITTIVIILSGYTRDFNYLLRTANYLTYTAYVFGFTLPAIWLIIAVIFKKGGRRKRV